MIRNNASRTAVAVITALSLSTSMALADDVAHSRRPPASSSAQAGARTAQPPPVRTSVVTPPTGPVEVHEYFSRDLENGCEYRSRVRGVVTPINASSASGTPLFTPNLRVSTAVHCPNVPATRSESVVRGRAVSSEQLASRVQQRARVRTSGAEDTCSYTPAFEFDRAQLAGRDVNFTCLAREGGVTTGGVYTEPDSDSPEIE